MGEVGGSEAVTCFCAWNQCSARLSQLNNLLAIFNYWIVINSFRMQLFCGAHHTCWTDSVLANLQGTHTKTFLAEIQGEIFKEHTGLFEVIFSPTLEADSTSGINALQGGWDGVHVYAGMWVNFQFSQSLVVCMNAGQIHGVWSIQN